MKEHLKVYCLINFYKYLEVDSLKIKLMMTALYMFTLLLGACQTTENKETAQPVKQEQTNKLPEYVSEKTFNQINWENVSVKFNSTSDTELIGTKGKLGIIGPELIPKKTEKWMWHFWGIDNGKLTLVGYNQKTSTFCPVFSDGTWSRDNIGGGKLNGDDASMPSNVSLPESGSWALLVYVDEKLFDTLIIDVKEAK